MNEQETLPKWPVVGSDDPGIRPFGRSNHCFYCNSEVGTPHGAECVIVEQRLRYNILYRGVVVGTWESDEPYHWTYERADWHRNMGTWCVDNALDDIKWNTTPESLEVQAKIEEQGDREDVCICGDLEFRAVETINPGPFISRR